MKTAIIRWGSRHDGVITQNVYGKPLNAITDWNELPLSAEGKFHYDKENSEISFFDHNGEEINIDHLFDDESKIHNL